MSDLLNSCEQMKPEMLEWFTHMHRNPELSMAEENTAAYIADLVRSWGFEVETGVGRHGAVASLSNGSGGRSIGIRADFDALPIEESNDLDYRSTVPGVAHLCGHDGHTTMLLAAGKYLADTRNFTGTVRLIFQPGEETMEGAPAMIADGLFERFQVDAVFAMHNMPGLATGEFFFTGGDVMAAVDNWEIVITGKGSHGAMPELGIDPVVVGSQLVMALQTIVARNIAPANRAVVTVGAFQAGQAGNVVAHTATLRLSIRTTTPEDREKALARVRSLTHGIAEANGATAEIREGVPGAVLTNHDEETRFALEVARDLFGEDQAHFPGPTFLGSEDFAFMLQKQRGSYLFIGNGDTPMVHHPEFTLNTGILPRGAAYWVALAESYLK